MNRGPNEKGKADQDNKQPPEDQDPHACNIRRSLPPFKAPWLVQPEHSKRVGELFASGRLANILGNAAVNTATAGGLTVSRATRGLQMPFLAVGMPSCANCDETASDNGRVRWVE